MNIEKFVTITKALSDPNRVRALLALRNGELCVCQIIELLKLAPSTISKHMSILKQAGLVKSRKDSRWVYFSLPHEETPCPEISDVIQKTISLLQMDDQITEDTTVVKSKVSKQIDEVCNRPCKSQNR